MSPIAKKEFTEAVSPRYRSLRKRLKTIMWNPEFEKPPGFSSSSSLSGNPPRGWGINKLSKLSV